MIGNYAILGRNGKINEIQEKVSSYTSNNTYAQKAFPKLNSVVVLGDYFTHNFFDAYLSWD